MTDKPDIVERLREGVIVDAFKDGRLIDGMLAERMIRERHEAADEIERLRLFEHYSNGPIEGMVENAIAYKKEHGKYPFED